MQALRMRPVMHERKHGLHLESARQLTSASEPSMRAVLKPHRCARFYLILGIRWGLVFI